MHWTNAHRDWWHVPCRTGDWERHGRRIAESRWSICRHVEGHSSRSGLSVRGVFHKWRHPKMDGWLWYVMMVYFMATPIYGWFLVGNPVTPFQETPIYSGVAIFHGDPSTRLMSRETDKGICHSIALQRQICCDSPQQYWKNRCQNT